MGDGSVCLWAKIGASLLMAALCVFTPFFISNMSQTRENTTKIEELSSMQQELRSNAQAIVRLTTVLENQMQLVTEVRSDVKSLALSFAESKRIPRN